MPIMDEFGAQFHLRIGGAEVPDELIRRVTEVVVRQTIGMHDEIRVAFDAGARAVVGVPSTDELVEQILDLGTEIEVTSAGAGSRATVFFGDAESVALESGDDRVGARGSIVVTGLARSHKLLEGVPKSRCFESMMISDVVSSVVSGSGITSRISDVGGGRHEFVAQVAQTDWEFLMQLAERVGCRAYVDRETLHFELPGDGRRVELSWGENLVDFDAHVSLAEEATSVSVRGWNPMRKEVVVGRAPSIPRPRLQEQVVHRPVTTTEEADILAAAIAGARAIERIRSQGVVKPGIGAIRPGTTLRVGGCGRRFGGDQLVRSATHRVTATDGYVTTFEVGPVEDQSRPSRAVSPHDAKGRTLGAGVVIGLVTDDDDPEGLGRVRVDFPWLDTAGLQTGWVRVATLRAGRGHGTVFVPRVDDEVLVAFDRGAFDHPVVIGALWNGVDGPPEPRVTGGFDSITSGAGHVIRLDDREGSERILIHSQAGEVVLESNGDVSINAATGTVRVKGHDVQLAAAGKLTLSADNDVEITAATALTLRAGTELRMDSGGDVNVNSNGDVDIDAQSDLSATAGSTAMIEAGSSATLRSANTTLEGDAVATLQGGVVMIN